MKRTPTCGDQNRDSVFRIRLTTSEKLLIKELAKRYGYRNVSKYLRSLISNNNLSGSIDRQTLILLHAELGKEGSNLNQIARAINIRLKTGEPINTNAPLLNKTLTNIEILTGQLTELLKNGHYR